MMADEYEYKMNLTWHDVDVELPSDDADEVPCLLLVKQTANKEADKRDMLGWRVTNTYLTGMYQGEDRWLIFEQAGNGNMLQKNPKDDTFCGQRVLYWAYLTVEEHDAKTMLRCSDPEKKYSESEGE